MSIPMTGCVRESGPKTVENLLRVSGRLNIFHLSFDTNHPVIQSALCLVADLLVQHTHAVEEHEDESHALSSTKTVLDIERKRNRKAGDQKGRAISDVHGSNGKTTHGLACKPQSDFRLVAI